MFTKNLWQVNDVSLLRHVGDVANTRAPGVTAGFPVKTYLGSRMHVRGRTVTTQLRQVSSFFRSVLVQNVSVFLRILPLQYCCITVMAYCELTFWQEP